MKSAILHILLIEGPHRGRHLKVDEDTARRGTVRVAEEPKLTVQRAPNKAEVLTGYQATIHRYITKWSPNLGWYGLYDGEE